MKWESDIRDEYCMLLRMRELVCIVNQGILGKSYKVNKCML